jgi:hypothetical protein
MSRCTLPLDGDLGPMTITDRSTGRTWHADSVFVASAGLYEKPRSWDVLYRNGVFSIQVDPHVASVAFAMPRDYVSDQPASFIDWGWSAEEATQFFILPGYRSQGPGLSVEENCESP